MGADVRLHRLPVLRRVKKPGGRPNVSKFGVGLGGRGSGHCWCWCGGGISQRLRPRGEGGRWHGDPTNAFALLSLVAVVDYSLALYAQLQVLLELRPREARPENSSIYIYIYIYISTLK